MISKVGDKMNTIESTIRKQTIIVVCSVLFISLIIMSASYSSFSNIGDVTNNVVVEYDSITATFKESDTIDLELPRLTDEKGLEQTGASFSVLNTSEENVAYTVVLTNIVGEREPLDPKYIKVSVDSESPILLSDVIVEENEYGIKASILKKKNDVGDVATHNVKVWATEDAPLNTKVYFKITITSSIATNVFSDHILALSENNAYDMVTNSGLIKDAFGNVRYFGESPDNYVLFNDELWRAVGVFNVIKANDREETRVKIVKDSPSFAMPYQISSNYSWNNNIGSVLLEYASQMSNAYINEDYLSEDATKLIDYALFHIGMIDDDKNYHATDYYANEMSEKDYNGRETELGLIAGLLTISDYYYASNDGNAGNYLRNGSAFWLMNYHSDIDKAYYVDETGLITEDASINEHPVRPTTYLKSTVSIVSGDGSLENPYVIH